MECMHVMASFSTMKVQDAVETFVTRKITRAAARISLGFTGKALPGQHEFSA